MNQDLEIQTELHDTVNRKFTDVVPVTDWQVLSDDGFVDIESVNQTIHYEVYRLVFSDGSILECADDHILMTVDGGEVFAVDSLGCSVIGVSGPLQVVSVEATGVYEQMYDLTVGGNHTFYTNNVLSHNSTTTAAFIAHYMLFNKHKTVAILANKAATAREILSRLQMMYEHLPKWMQSGVVEWNKGSFQLENGCKAIAAATSGSAIRGTSIAMLVLDEFAFIPENQAMEFFESVYPTISSGKESRILIFSTPKGMNHFYKMWVEAEEGRSEFVPISISWDEVPGRDEEWKQKTISNIGQDSWDQEFAGDFLGAVGTLIKPSILKTLAFKEPLSGYDGSMRVWEEPIKGHSYFITVDTSRGGGADYSVVQVIDITEFPYKQVANFRNNTIRHFMLPRIVVEMGKKYNDSYVLVETNDIGEAVADSIYQEFEYENLMFVGESKGKAILNPWRNGKTGLRTTTATKNIGCSTLKVMVEEKKIILNDWETITELSRFVAKGKSFEAENGAHDDLVMTLVIFAWAAAQPNFKDITNSDFRAQYIKENEDEMMRQLAPVGYFPHLEKEQDDGWVNITELYR